MSQPNPYGHRLSVPINFYQQYGQTHSQEQQRSFSTSHASFSNDPSASLVSGGGSQWRNGEGYPSNGLDDLWPQEQQHQQYAQTQGTQQQTDPIPNILGDVQSVIQSRSLNEGPLFLYGAQQKPLSFDSEQFQQSGSGALTAIPDTRSQQQSFADSGYGSQQKEPVPGDESLQQTSDQYLSPTKLGQQRPRGRKGPRSVASDGVLHSQGRIGKSPRNLHRCPYCDKKGIKNASDLRKHINAHEKPFKCEVTECERHEDGFGTVNDLERHRASVHSLAARCGTTAGFICVACEQDRPGNNKWWPRKDNFKSHIRRRHPNWDEEMLVKGSTFASRPQDVDLRSATSQHAQEEDQFQQDFPEALNDFSNFNDPLPLGRGTDGDIVAEGGQWASGDSAARDMLASSMGMTTNMARGHSFHGRTTTVDPNVGLSPTDSVLRSAGMPTPTFRITDFGQNSHLQSHDMASWRRSSMNAQLTPVSSQATCSDHGYKCPECPRFVKRACDLRKHQKRHSRPYGCTFPGCFKRFGSRNDWKRHENSQHQILEQWRCPIPNHDGSACARLFDKQSGMVGHLESRHGFEQLVHWDAIDQAHLGHEGHHQFWCGFCNMPIVQRENVHHANWDNRFQHIGDHFDKDKLTIDDWVDIEANKKKRLLIPPKSAKRSATKDSDSGDESDLGDDGIPTDSNAVTPFMAPGNTAPGNGSAGYNTHLSVRGEMCAMDGRMHLSGEEDAEGEVDQQFMMMNV